MNTITYFPFGNGPNKSLAIEFHALVGKGVLCIEAGLKGCDTTTSTRFNETNTLWRSVVGIIKRVPLRIIFPRVESSYRNGY